MGTESLEKYQTWQVTVDEMQENKAEKAYFEIKKKKKLTCCLISSKKTSIFLKIYTILIWNQDLLIGHCQEGHSLSIVAPENMNIYNHRGVFYSYFYTHIRELENTMIECLEDWGARPVLNFKTELTLIEHVLIADGKQSINGHLGGPVLGYLQLVGVSLVLNSPPADTIFNVKLQKCQI